MARVDVYVPDDQIDEASYVLLVAEVDEADEILDDDRAADPRRRGRCRVVVGRGADPVRAARRPDRAGAALVLTLRPRRAVDGQGEQGCRARRS